MKKLLSVIIFGVIVSMMLCSCSKSTDKSQQKSLPLEGLVIGIDPGRQKVPDKETEPISPLK